MLTPAETETVRAVLGSQPVSSPTPAAPRIIRSVGDAQAATKALGARRSPVQPRRSTPDGHGEHCTCLWCRGETG